MDHQQEPPPQGEGVILPRPLKSCEPDLSVIVGQVVTYHHHAAVLASYSDYIDTMLSTPMQERQSRTIRFPDIRPKTWEKIMQMHQIGGASVLSESLSTDATFFLEVLPILDEYAFTQAVKVCDDMLQRYFERINSGGFFGTAAILIQSIDLAKLSCNLNLSLSRSAVVAFVKSQLQIMPTKLDEEKVRELLFLVKGEDEILRSVATVVHGSDASDKSLEDIRDIVLHNGAFAGRFRTKALQLDEQDDMTRHLQIKYCTITTSPEGMHDLVGRYTRHIISRSGIEAGRAAMKYFYHRTYEDEDSGQRRRIVIEALDPFGEEWSISDVLSSEEEVAFSNNVSLRTETKVLFTWKSSFGSLLPPRFGWVSASSSEVMICKSPPTLDYDIVSGRNY